MDPIDQLPPDLNAVLSLLLRQGRSYADIANLLGIPQGAVRDRAHAALDAIASDSAPGPASGAAPRTPSRAPDDPPERRPAAPRTSTAPSAPARPLRPASAPGAAPGASRRAGALLLGAIVAVIVVAVVLIANSSGGGGSHKSTTAGTTTSATGTTREPHIDKQLNLTSPNSSSSAVGLVEIVSEGSKRAFLVNAEHLPPTSAGSFFYAAWLYNSPSDARVLGRAPPVSSSGRLQAVGALPSNAAHFHQMLITRETATKPSHPGPIVLSGPFSLH